MRAAIYARYSSENQSEKSIEDQIRVCQRYCDEHEIIVDDRNIFTDQAISGALNQNTIISSMALKELLGAITLEPVLSKDGDYYRLFEGHEMDFRPYYVAHTKIETLALLDDEHKGSNWYQWRREIGRASCRERVCQYV